MKPPARRTRNPRGQAHQGDTAAIRRSLAKSGRLSTQAIEYLIGLRETQSRQDAYRSALRATRGMWEIDDAEAIQGANRLTLEIQGGAPELLAEAMRQAEQLARVNLDAKLNAALNNLDPESERAAIRDNLERFARVARDLVPDDRDPEEAPLVVTRDLKREPPANPG